MSLEIFNPEMYSRCLKFDFPLLLGIDTDIYILLYFLFLNTTFLGNGTGGIKSGVYW